MTAILEVRNLVKRFSGLIALNDVSIRVEKAEIRGLIGPNGAGKSTLFKNIAGFYAPNKGEILFDGQSIYNKKPCDIAQMGLVRTFQETTLFQEMTVLQNVMIGCHLSSKCTIFEAIFKTDKKKQNIIIEKSKEILNFVKMYDRKDQLASELPLGSQRSLAIAIALAAEPRLILMDEPFAGMNPEETSQVMELTKEINDTGVTIVLVEHDMKAVMGICNYLTVLNFGRLLAEGTPEEIKNNDQVIEAYLGGDIIS